MCSVNEIFSSQGKPQYYASISCRIKVGFLMRIFELWLPYFSVCIFKESLIWNGPTVTELYQMWVWPQLVSLCPHNNTLMKTYFILPSSHLLSLISTLISLWYLLCINKILLSEPAELFFIYIYLMFKSHGIGT